MVLRPAGCVCIGLVVTRVLDMKTAFSGFFDGNVILFVAMFIVGGALFETGMANEMLACALRPAELLPSLQAVKECS